MHFTPAVTLQMSDRLSDWQIHKLNSAKFSNLQKAAQHMVSAVTQVGLILTLALWLLTGAASGGLALLSAFVFPSGASIFTPLPDCPSSSPTGAHLIILSR